MASSAEHYRHAEILLERAGDADAHGIKGLSANRVAAAQVHATLSLVEQQRLANLIELEQFATESRLFDENDQLRTEIRGMLGML